MVKMICATFCQTLQDVNGCASWHTLQRSSRSMNVEMKDRFENFHNNPFEHGQQQRGPYLERHDHGLEVHNAIYDKSSLLFESSKLMHTFDKAIEAVQEPLHFVAGDHMKDGPYEGERKGWVTMAVLSFQQLLGYQFLLPHIGLVESNQRESHLELLFVQSSMNVKGQ